MRKGRYILQCLAWVAYLLLGEEVGLEAHNNKKKSAQPFDGKECWHLTLPQFRAKIKKNTSEKLFQTIDTTKPKKKKPPQCFLSTRIPPLKNKKHVRRFVVIFFWGMGEFPSTIGDEKVTKLNHLVFNILGPHNGLWNNPEKITG